MNIGPLLKVLAAFCFGLDVVLILAHSTASDLTAILIPLGLGLWVVSEIAGSAFKLRR